MSKGKDLNDIAAIEKAIAKKYGKVAVKNPKSGWDDKKEAEYLEQQKKVVEDIERNFGKLNYVPLDSIATVEKKDD